MYGINTNFNPSVQGSYYNAGQMGQVLNTQAPSSSQLDSNLSLIGRDIGGQTILPFPYRPSPINQLIGMIDKLIGIIRNMIGMLSGQLGSSDTVNTCKGPDGTSLTASTCTNTASGTQQENSSLLGQIFDFGSKLFDSEGSGWDKLKAIGSSIWKGASSLVGKFTSWL